MLSMKAFSAPDLSGPNTKETISVHRAGESLTLTRTQKLEDRVGGGFRMQSSTESRTLTMGLSRSTPYVRGTAIALAGLGLAAAPVILGASAAVAIGVAVASVAATAGALVALNRWAEARYQRIAAVFPGVRDRVFDEATRMANNGQWRAIDPLKMVRAGYQEAVELAKKAA